MKTRVLTWYNIKTGHTLYAVQRWIEGPVTTSLGTKAAAGWDWRGGFEGVGWQPDKEKAQRIAREVSEGKVWAPAGFESIIEYSDGIAFTPPDGGNPW